MAGEDPVVDWRDLPPVSEAEQPRVPDHPSQTFLKHHDACDRAAMLYLKHKAGAGSHAMNRGSAFHDVVARLIQRMVESGENTMPPEVGKDELLAYFDENPEVQMSAFERDACRMMIHNWCQATWLDPSKVIAVETTLQLELGGYTIVGRVDLAEVIAADTIQVTDWKTQFNLPDADEFLPQTFTDSGAPRFAGNFQTQVYALLLAFGTLDDGLPIGDVYERFRVRLAFPRIPRVEGLAERSATISRVQLLDFKLDLESQLRRLREVNDAQRKWQPTPGNHCRECPAEYECPLPKLLRPESQHADLDSIEDLEKAATNWLFMSKRATNLKARLKKATERLAEENPEAVTLPGGDVGVYAGKDMALMFIQSERETTKDKAALRAAIEDSVRYGTEFDWASHFKSSIGTTFDKRRVPPRERANGAEENTTPDGE